MHVVQDLFEGGKKSRKYGNCHVNDLNQALSLHFMFLSTAVLVFNQE